MKHGFLNTNLLERTKASYLLKRAYFTGNLYTRRKILYNDSNSFYLKFIVFTKAISFLILSIFLTIVFIPNNHWRIHWSSKVASNVGHISAIFGVKIKAYR